MVHSLRGASHPTKKSSQVIPHLPPGHGAAVLGVSHSQNGVCSFSVGLALPCVAALIYPGGVVLEAFVHIHHDDGWLTCHDLQGCAPPGGCCDLAETQSGWVPHLPSRTLIRQTGFMPGLHTAPCKHICAHSFRLQRHNAGVNAQAARYYQQSGTNSDCLVTGLIPRHVGHECRTSA